MLVRRIFVEKKKGFDIESKKLFHEIKHSLMIKGLENIRIINRYDIEGISDEVYKQGKHIVFSEPPLDISIDEEFNTDSKDRVIVIEYLPGQYDQRADSAAQCIQILTQKVRPEVKTAKLLVISGDINDIEYEKIKNYCINPVESHEAKLEKYKTLKTEYKVPEDVEILKGFINMDDKGAEDLYESLQLAMSFEDFLFCQKYFNNTEKRNPTITEIRVIDTYWSDHCRHTTFFTKISNIEFEEGTITNKIKNTYNKYLKDRKEVYKNRNKDICLMDMATLAMKKLKLNGKLKDLDESEEINACSICVNIEVDGEAQEWLVMFKNETHNHPTEIEPFGGAATCLGGAIRDPLSGRSYVYQAMRVTGAGDPRVKIEDTLPGKLPQKKISTTAAHGYSSYGNQIGLATGQVHEIYHPDYVTKRMEIGAVIAAAPKENVIRQVPEPGDAVILLGGRTGRDGCGGATGSSKEHTEESLSTCGAEVQKGNPPTERKIQRLFRKNKVSKMIIRCNDFGAGGVAVAIGEIADSLDINLDAVPKKYAGLDGTELAISESQERMAVVVKPENIDILIKYAHEENLEAVHVAKITNTGRMCMIWRNNTIVSLKRDFLSTNGVTQEADVNVMEPKSEADYFEKTQYISNNIKEDWQKQLSDLNVASQKGLGEMFDSTIGLGTVHMPFGGNHQLTPTEGMVAKIPVLKGNTNSGTAMTFGFNPFISEWSPYHGAVYAVLESIAKITAIGGDFSKSRLTFQEYFEKLGKESDRWGKPFSSLLGAYDAQINLEIPAIGGKDSMSGSFMDMNVPPTLVSFAVNVLDTEKSVSPEFKDTENEVYAIHINKDVYNLPDYKHAKETYNKIFDMIQEGLVLASSVIKQGGVAAAISKMCFGNMIGFEFNNEYKNEKLFYPDYGAIILEFDSNKSYKADIDGLVKTKIGKTIEKKEIKVNNTIILLKDLLNTWQEPLEDIFPTKTEEMEEKVVNQIALDHYKCDNHKTLKTGVQPKVFIPVFPGTNCEYDTVRAFEKAGATTDVLVFKNLNSKDIEDSINQIVEKINSSQIVMIPGGFSAGDEPEGSGKFILSVFSNPYISEAVMQLLNKRDGLMLGICNGFQALIKLGLVPYGEIRTPDTNSPTLTFNTIGRHVSCLVSTKIVSNKSPWLSSTNVGDIHKVAVSHGEGRFIADEQTIMALSKNGQIATQYTDLLGNPTNDIQYNPNGSLYAIEGITSPDGRVFGKMGHSERYAEGLFKNISGNKDQHIFSSGVNYFL